MSTGPKPLSDLIQELSASDREAVRELVESLLSRRRPKVKRRLRQDWAGALSEHREEFTALDLQQKALEWRDET